MKNVVILTGQELRHSYMRMRIASSPEINVIRSYCEGLEKSLVTLVDRKEDNQIQAAHLKARAITEQDFFGDFVECSEDLSNPIQIIKGDINKEEHVQDIIALNPDIILCYGASIIKPPLIQAFPGRFINIHLGLSPYYRGSGTNFWPLVEGEPEYVGTTFMYIDEGIDTGEILHQIQADIHPYDNVHTIGNRLIAKTARTTVEILTHFDEICPIAQPSLGSRTEKYYRKKDFTDASVEKMYAQFQANMVSTFLEEKRQGLRRVELGKNPVLESLPAGNPS